MEASRQLAHRTEDQAQAEPTRREKGSRVTHRLWRAPIRGFLRWSHARQLVRIQWVVEEPNGTVREGNRYFVTNLPTGRLNATGWLTLVGMHWRVENNGHWTTDVVWKEDARRTEWTTHPQAVYALAVLRMIALNILALLRSGTRQAWESKRPRWAQVVQTVRFILAAGSLVPGSRRSRPQSLGDCSEKSLPDFKGAERLSDLGSNLIQPDHPLHAVVKSPIVEYLVLVRRWCNSAERSPHASVGAGKVRIRHGCCQAH